MSQVAIPFEFESYLQDRLVNGLAPDMNEMIFAYLPDLDPEQVIDRHLGLPAPSYWVYRQDISQKAKLNDDSVVYSVVIPGEVETFTFNAIYLHDKHTADSCGLVVHKIAETKEPEMSSVRTCVQQYSGAARAAKITVTPESWQIDYQARLYGMDDDLRLACFDLFGPASFFDDGFLVRRSGSQYICEAGTGYVAGLRCVNDIQTEITDAQPDSGIYLDVSWQGQVLSRWATNWKLVVSSTTLTDYVDEGTQHYVTQIAHIEADSSITDLRHLGLDEQKLPDATTAAKGAVVLATDNEVKTGLGSGVLSPEQLKKALAQFGSFGTPVDLGVISNNAELDHVPTGFIHFASSLITGKQTEYQGMKVQHPDGYYSVIAGADDAGKNALVVYHSHGNRWAEALLAEHSNTMCPVGVPLPWPSDVAPDGWAMMKGQQFDTEAYPVLASLYTDGFLPDMRGLAIVGKKDDEAVLAYEADEVKSHGHDATVADINLGNVASAAAGYHAHTLSATGSDGYTRYGAGKIYTVGGDGGWNSGNGMINSISASGNHSHTIALGSHGHSITVSESGSGENTIKNRKFNWIVRLG
ncbi:tail fiber protein [Vibrio mangrovi]|uniref:Tail fiber protein n=1 Tax=Vibrio mangrovi TaxID=474394 RepID=A0A1Y6IWM0_9VIBR|nr:tail fiber protein [Vibrio mangrovi]MDW6005504.1 tail fiber protein [Vibrio mangrovi]SMS02054.1 Tail fiber protein [Vibrio mangrovi]